VDVVLDAVALRVTAGYRAAAKELTRALKLLLALDTRADHARRWLWLAGGRAGTLIALDSWDFESGFALAVRQVQVTRDMGALVQLQLALNFLARVHVLAGELSAAERLLDEDRLIAEATGTPPATHSAMMLAAWQGREQPARELILAAPRMADDGHDTGRLAGLAACASAVLENGLGQYDAARAAAHVIFERDDVAFGPLIVGELAEASARTGDVAAVRAALDWLSERARATPTEWALGVEARIRALLDDGQAESSYRESIQRLGRTPVRAELARSHLLYGEWLRREGRRVDAREQLRLAFDMLDAMGMGAFAERAGRELLATGETARKRTAGSASDGAGEALTAQEATVARLARDGLSNPEIGARLFISPRTVKYHLSKVFTKLGVSSRSQLYRVLPADPGSTRPS
jgi:DNA-binding CsgD family transcriptional regulator